MARKSTDTATWGKRGTVISILFSLGCFIAGCLFTKWITVDTQKEYIKQLINNAISEIDCNLTNAWYVTDNYVSMNLYFADLRNQALWNVYYNKKLIFADDIATSDQVLNGIYEIDWINRLALSQYKNSGFLISIDNPYETPSTSDIEKAMKNPNQPIVTIHQDMVSPI